MSRKRPAERPGGLSHWKVADAAASWLAKPFSSLVVQELSTVSYSSRSRGQFRMDVVGVVPNGRRITIVECKAQRSDWLANRGKLEEYRSYCHLLFVAAPKGIVKPEELPPGVGLLTVYESGASARCVKWSRLNEMTDEMYRLMLERVVQKLIVTRSQADQESVWLQRSLHYDFKSWLREVEQ